MEEVSINTDIASALKHNDVICPRAIPHYGGAGYTYCRRCSWNQYYATRPVNVMLHVLFCEILTPNIQITVDKSGCFAREFLWFE